MKVTNEKGLISIKELTEQEAEVLMIAVLNGAEARWQEMVFRENTKNGTSQINRNYSTYSTFGNSTREISLLQAKQSQPIILTLMK